MAYNKITIVDYGAGNIGSLVNMIRKLGGQSIVTSDLLEIERSEKLILPGVGKFDYGINQLKKSGIIPVLNKKVFENKIPILGICLGAQLMTNSSEEGNESGLNWFDAEVKLFKFDSSTNLRTPHMGWNEIKILKESPLSFNLPDESRFYFVHSYYIKSNDKRNDLISGYYGHEFIAGLSKDNIYAVQFHPEKSHKFGLQLFRNFLEL